MDFDEFCSGSKVDKFYKQLYEYFHLHQIVMESQSSLKMSNYLLSVLKNSTHHSVDDILFLDRPILLQNCLELSKHTPILHFLFSPQWMPVLLSNDFHNQK